MAAISPRGYSPGAALGLVIFQNTGADPSAGPDIVAPGRVRQVLAQRDHRDRLEGCGLELRVLFMALAVSSASIHAS